MGRNEPCFCGEKDDNGNPIKFKKCCLEEIKSGKKSVVSFTRSDFISGSYKECPSCKRQNSFGVFFPISGSCFYTRECIRCHFQKNIKLPK